MKCNVDAAFSDGESTGAAGIALRDHDGRTCGGKAIWYEHCLNAITAEAMACRDGMQYVRDHRVQNSIVEMDCQILVKLWEKRSLQRSKVDPILHQMVDLSRNFEGFRLCFISRNCNRLAHECARLVNREQPVMEWLITPQGLRATIDDDCNLAYG